MGLRKLLRHIEPAFQPGGKYHRFYALFEMVDTLLYSPADTTPHAPHARDALDLKRVMGYVWLATFPAMFMACYNTGLQANLGMQELGMASADSWRGAIMDIFGYDPESFIDNFMHGLLYFLPVYIVTFVVGGAAEVIFSLVRGHEVNEGFFVTSILYALILPPTIPLWQVAVGISFGVVIGKEIFGGTGFNILNPALTGRAFLFFAYPAAMSGDTVWVAVDGYSGATALSSAAVGGVDAILASTPGLSQGTSVAELHCRCNASSYRNEALSSQISCLLRTE